MGLTNTYVLVYGKIPSLFQKIRDGQAPEQVTQQLLKDWGFPSSNDRQFLPMLKAIGFLSADGKPTSRYHAYRDHTRSMAVMGEALRESYQDLFLIKAKPTKQDREAIEGKFKSYHNASDRVAALMTNTFFALLSLADLDNPEIDELQKKLPQVQVGNDNSDVKEEPVKRPEHRSAGPALHYNIQIHLPATKDVEVYNKIFRSLKEHFFEV